jgi:hypothetical protein
MNLQIAFICYQLKITIFNKINITVLYIKQEKDLEHYPLRGNQPTLF